MLPVARRPIYLFVLTILAILASQMPAHACSVSGEPPTLEETVDSADIVVVGQVIGTDGFPAYRAALLVEKYLKGSGPDILFSEGYGFGGGDCDNAVAMWQRGIFYLDGDITLSETLIASYSYPYYAVHSVNDRTVTEIIQVTGHDEYPAHSLFDLNIRAFGMSVYGIFNPYVYVFAFIFVLPILFIAAAIFLLRYLYRMTHAFVSSRR